MATSMAPSPVKMNAQRASHGDGHVGLKCEVVGEISRTQRIEIPTALDGPKWLARTMGLQHRSIEVQLQMATTTLVDANGRSVHVLHVRADDVTAPLLGLAGLRRFHPCPVWAFGACCYREMERVPSEDDLRQWADSFARLVGAGRMCAENWEFVKLAVADLSAAPVPTFAEVVAEALEGTGRPDLAPALGPRAAGVPDTRPT